MMAEIPGGFSPRQDRQEVLIRQLQGRTGLPRALVFRNAVQSIGSGAFVAVQFNNESYDRPNDNQHDNAANNTRLTCRAQGLYLVTASWEWATVAAGQRFGRILVTRAAGGTLALGGDGKSPSGATQQAGNITVQVEMVVGDYAELQVFQDSGGAVNVGGTGNLLTHLAWARIGP